MCQLNLRFLIDPTVPERSTLELARQFAHDLDKALDYFITLQEGLVAFAETVEWSEGADPRAKNKYFCATTFYNQGRTGGVRNIQNNTSNAHATGIARQEKEYARLLGLHSVMADVIPG